MAIGYGLGLAFQGTPKDYVELVKSKQAAQQKAALNKATKDAARLQRTYDDFIRQVGTSSVLPINEKDVMNELNTFRTVMDAETEKDSPDFNTVTQAATQAVFNIKQMAATKKSWDSIKANAAKYGLTQEESFAIDSETDPAKFANILSQNGSTLVNYDAQNNRISVAPISDYKPVTESLDTFLKNKMVYNTPDVGKAERIAKTNITYYGVDPGAKANWVRQNIDLPSTSRDFNVYLKANKLPIPATSEEYVATKAKYLGDLFEEDAKNRYVRDKVSEGKGLTINIGGDKETAPGTAFIGDQDINYGPSNLGLSVRTKASYTVANASSISGVPTNTINLTTFDDFTGINSATFSTATVYVAPVFNSDYIAEYKGQKIPFKKGQVVPQQIENTVKKDGKLVYDKVGWGTVNIPQGAQGVPVQIPPSQTVNAMYNTLDKAEKAQLEGEVRRLNAQIGRLNKPAAPTQQREAAKPKGTTLPPLEEWLKQNLGKNYNDYKLLEREAKKQSR
jgi:hypothetical protein